LRRASGSALPLPGSTLLSIDRITGYWPLGGRAGLGRLRAESDVQPDAWFFRAHFFQDPVQPGSIGLEAMLQALSVLWVLHGGNGSSRSGVRSFGPYPAGERAVWKYRGQVRPGARKVEIIVDALEDRGHGLVGEAWLWVDGMRIYHAPRLCVGPGRGT
jgi:3-hydroxymyristoyl/3-hydroxydecanoyl-(acyl carrier protein) dehydratase